MNLGGIRENKIICFLADFRAATKAHAVTAFRMSRGSVNIAVDRLTERGLVAGVGRNHYVTQRAVAMLAARDRVDAKRLVEVTYLDPNGEDAKRERRHDEAVAAVAAKFMGKGIPAVAGWRWVVSWADGQLVPDLWVQLPVSGQEQGTWIAVEIEFSARTPQRIQAGKLRSFRLAPTKLDQTFPMLAITGEASAAKHFDNLAGNLPILTTTLKEFLTGVWEGEESVWRRKGRRVDLNDIATEHQPHLLQLTGRPFDKTEPSGEVWAKLSSEEFILLDPHTDLGGMERPYIDLSLLRQEKPAEGKPTAGPTEIRTAATPAPSATPPAPVPVAPTAEEQARQRRKLLTEINYLVALADEMVADRLNLGTLSEAERLCLRRVQAIITYGNFRHRFGAEGIAEQLRQICLELREEHKQALRSRGFWWWLSSATTMEPRAAFEHILEKHRKHRKAACKIFDDWFEMVERGSQPIR